MTTVMEQVTFRLIDGVDMEAWQAAAQSLHGLVKGLPGFYYRSVTQDEHGLWYDTLYWQDMTAAEAAGEAFLQSEQGRTLMEFIQMDTVTRRLMPVVTEAMSCEEGS